MQKNGKNTHSIYIAKERLTSVSESSTGENRQGKESNTGKTKKGLKSVEETSQEDLQIPTT